MTDDARKRLLEGLNEDLRGEFQAIIMYRLYASLVQGPYRQELRTFFANEIPEELGHAQILAAGNRSARLSVTDARSQKTACQQRGDDSMNAFPAQSRLQSTRATLFSCEKS